MVKNELLANIVVSLRMKYNELNKIGYQKEATDL